MSQTQLTGLSSNSVFADPADGSQRPQVEPLVLGLKRSVWIQIGVISVLFAALFWPNLRRLWDKTNPIYGEANWGHAICIPLIGLYYLWVNREKLLSEEELLPDDSDRPIHRGVNWRVFAMVMIALVLPLGLLRYEARKYLFPAAALSAVLLLAATLIYVLPNTQTLVRRLERHSAGWFGGFIMLFGVAVFQYAIFPGQNDFLKDLGMVITLFGVVLALAGWHVMSVAWFPIVFLVCGIPWPGLVYSKIAGPLQQLAANVAVWTLQLTGVEANVGGTKISMIGGDGNWRTLNVAEACAGMRSLMTFISVAAAVAFLSHRPLWQKIIVVIFAVPIAIFCNVMRVSGQGLLDRYVSHSLSENFAHQFVGLIMLIPAFLLILLVGWILDQIFVEQIDRRVVAIAPKVITRSSPPVAAALQPKAAPRSLASLRVDQSPTPAIPVAAPKPAPSPAIQKTPSLPKPSIPKPATPRPAPALQNPYAAPVAQKSAPALANAIAPQKPRPPVGDLKSIVPPPPSVRLATRAPSPKKPNRGNGANGSSNGNSTNDNSTPKGPAI
jgi:exosortase